MIRYGELHSHDEWSALDGSGSALEGAQRAAELGHPFLAKTNHAVLSGVFHHVGACREVGIVPLVAVEAYYRPSRFPPRKDEVDDWPYFHMLLIAKSARGWRTLRLLTSEAYRSGFHQATKTHHSSLKPCVDDELLDRWHEDIIMSTTCVAGYVPRMIVAGRHEEAERHMDQMDRWVGDDWYAEAQPHGFADQVLINPILKQYAQLRSRPLVATRDTHFVRPKDHAVQQAIVLMRTKSTIAERSKAAFEEDKGYDLVAAPTAYIASAQDTIDLFMANHSSMGRACVEEAVSNTFEIASRCVPISFDRSPKLPRFKPDQDDAGDLDELRRITYDGLKKLGKDGDDRFAAQAERELSIFEERRICSFFLITHDFVDWGRSTRPMPELPGGSTPENDPFYWATERGGGRTEPLKIGCRGSAAASVVLYALFITLMNPITYGFRFERFLNRNRQGLPDVDIDMSDDAARMLEAYVKRHPRYGGSNRVYDLIAHGTFGAKAALRRVSAVYSVPPAEYNTASKLIEDTDDRLVDLREAIPELNRYFEAHEDVFDVASKLQKRVQSISEHPAGVVISGVPLEEAGMPTMKKSIADDYMVTAVGETATTELESKEDVELVTGLGFMKVDFLRVTEMAKHAYCERLINRLYDADVRLEQLPVYDDPRSVEERVMERIIRAKLGIFQLCGSPGVVRFKRDARPRDVRHMAAISAIYRPATREKLQDDYVARMRDPDKITYWHPSVKPITEETLGLMVFQEQVMDVLVALGGFDPARADDVRKIMSKYYRAKGDLAQRMLGSHHDDFVSSASKIMGSVRDAEDVWANVGEFSGYSFNKPHAGSYAVVGYTDGWVMEHYPQVFWASLLTFPPAYVKKPEQRVAFWEKAVREARLDGVDILPPDVNDSDGSFTVTADGVRFGLTSISGIGPKAVEAIVEGRPWGSLEDLAARVGNKCNAGHRRALGAAGALDRWGVRDHLSPDERAGSEKRTLNIALSQGDRIGPYKEGLSRLCHTQAEFDAAPNGAPIIVGGEIVSGGERATKKGPSLKAIIAFGSDEYVAKWAPWDYTDAVREIIDVDRPVIVRGHKDERWGCVQVDSIELAADVLGGLGLTDHSAAINLDVLGAAA